MQLYVKIFPLGDTSSGTLFLFCFRCVFFFALVVWLSILSRVMSTLYRIVRGGSFWFGAHTVFHRLSQKPCSCFAGVVPSCARRERAMYNKNAPSVVTTATPVPGTDHRGRFVSSDRCCKLHAIPTPLYCTHCTTAVPCRCRKKTGV